MKSTGRFFFVIALLAGLGIWFICGGDPERPQSLSRTEVQTAAATVAAIPQLKSPESQPSDNAHARLQIRLSGVLVTGSGDHRFPVAIVSMNGGKESVMRVGEFLTSSARIVSIGDDYLTYESGNSVFRVTVDTGNSGGPAALSAPPPNIANVANATGKFAGFIPNPITVPTGGSAGPSPEPESGNSIFKRDVDKRIATMQAQP